MGWLKDRWEKRRIRKDVDAILDRLRKQLPDGVRPRDDECTGLLSEVLRDADSESASKRFVNALRRSPGKYLERRWGTKVVFEETRRSAGPSTPAAVPSGDDPAMASQYRPELETSLRLGPNGLEVVEPVINTAVLRFDELRSDFLAVVRKGRHTDA